MPLWPCDWKLCSRPALQGAGNCISCDKHLCRSHLHDPQHTCPNPDKYHDAYYDAYGVAEDRKLNVLLEKLDQPALLARASYLRGGVGCSGDFSRTSLTSMMGGQNAHAVVVFSDGVQWIARFRLEGVHSPPAEVRDYVLRSEVATIKFLAKETKVPVPKVYDWAASDSERENPVGVSYILMDKIKGKPLDWYEVTEEQKKKFMSQLADIFIELEKHPFSAAGSLVLKPGDEKAAKRDTRVDGYATPALYRRGSGGPLGPFESTTEAAKSIIESYLNMLASGEMGSQSPVEEYLLHAYRLQLLAADNKQQHHHPYPPNTGTKKAENFFFNHPDGKGDHIMIDPETHNIVAIIDWEWARTASHAEAFSSPCMMWPIGDFYEGRNQLSADENEFARILEEDKGRPDMAGVVRLGRRTQRFWFDLGPEGWNTPWKDRIKLFEGLRRAYEGGGDADDQDDGKRWNWEAWRRGMLDRIGGDNDRLQRLLAEQAKESS